MSALPNGSGSWPASAPTRPSFGRKELSRRRTSERHEAPSRRPTDTVGVFRMFRDAATHAPLPVQTVGAQTGFPTFPHSVAGFH